MSIPEERTYPIRIYRRRRRWPWAIVVLLLLLAGIFLIWQRYELPLSQEESDKVSSAEQALGTKPLELWGSSRGKTILLVGADRRAGDGEQWGRSDTIIVARLLPSENMISLLSLPRDLQVEIPGYGFDKINAAYSFGGPRLLISTVRDWTGSPIDHFVEIDFEGFARMIDEVGGVYLPVDQRYYHSNEGLAAEEMYSEIDLEAGYQLLGDEDALAFVRHRYTDSDFIRAARQQIFLRELARQLQSKATQTSSFLGLARAFADATTSDIRSPKAMLALGNAARSISSDRVIRVTPEADELISGGVFYLVASPEQRERALQVWNNPSLLTESPQKLRYTPLGEVVLDKSSWLVRSAQGRPFAIKTINNEAPLAPVAKALSDWRPLMYSTNATFAPLRKELALAQGSKPSDDNISRDKLRGENSPDLAPVPAPDPPSSPLRPCRPEALPPGYSWGEGYRQYFLEERPAISLWAGMPGEGGILWNWVAWKRAPILQKPDQVLRQGKRKLFLFWDSGRLRLVAWPSGVGYGWVTNTLNGSLDAATMLALARSCKRP